MVRKSKLSRGQYQLLARYAEDISKVVAFYDVTGYFLPSVLPAAIQPTVAQFFGGVFVVLTGLLVALILEGKAGRLK